MESFGQREAVAGYEHDEEDCALVEGKNGEDADGARTVHGRDVLFERVRSFTTNGWLQSKIEAARARGREALSMLQDSLEEELDAALHRSGQHVAPMRGGLDSGQGMAVQSGAPDAESELQTEHSSLSLFHPSARPSSGALEVWRLRPRAGGTRHGHAARVPAYREPSSA